MDFDFSAEQYALRDEARRFLNAQCPPSHVREFIDEDSSFSRDLWKRMSDLGWMSLAIPEEYGGLGQSLLDQFLLLGELGRALAPVPFLSSAVFAAQALVRHGSEEQKARLLPAIASGERVGAFALTADVVLDAPVADFFILGNGGGLVLVEEGFSVTARVPFDPTRTVGSVSFSSSEPLPGAGHDAARRIATAAVCAEMVGVAERVLEMTVEYSKVREQFGRPIGSFQAIKHRCAEMAVDLEASRSAAMYAAWAVTAGTQEADLAASVAKSFCSSSLARLGGEGVQVHGGIAFTWEHDMHLCLRRIKSDEALLGDAAHHRERIAKLAGL